MARVPRSANDLLRQSYSAARSFVKRDEQRELTQREYLDTVFGLNPRTGKPYNERTLRKWLSGERKADTVVARAKAGGGTIQQTYTVVIDKERRTFSQDIAIPVERNRLELFTPKGRRDIRRAVKEAVSDKAIGAGTSAPLRGKAPALPPPSPDDSARWVHVKRQTLKLSRARAVHTHKSSAIVTRRSTQKAA